MILYKTFEDRLRYLKLNGTVGFETFGYDRIFNQKFYTSTEWRKVRREIILRDNGCDLGILEYEISNYDTIVIHHLNPISMDDISERTELLLNPEFLVCTTKRTHRMIHYGDANKIIPISIERKKNDTCPWR